MKKLITMILALICVLGLANCSVNPRSGLDKAAKIKITNYSSVNGEKGETATITGETDIRHIVDDLASLKLEKVKFTGILGPMAIEYGLFFSTRKEMRSRRSLFCIPT